MLMVSSSTSGAMYLEWNKELCTKHEGGSLYQRIDAEVRVCETAAPMQLFGEQKQALSSTAQPFWIQIYTAAQR